MRKPARPCNKCGKGTYNRPRYCDTCKRPPKTENRPTAPERGYDHTWKKLRIVAGDRDDWICAKCGKPAGKSAHIDHIIPISQGGERLDLDNLQTLCHRCHSEKTAGERWERKV